MVKRQKEKQYQSAREHKQNAQLRSGSGALGGSVQKHLPFHCCALTLNPFEQPVCTLTSGVIFDSNALTDFVLQHQKDPVTGNPLSTRDICTLHMDQDENGRWQCPVLTKPFADHTKIVAVLDRSCNEAYVYSYEAYHELNVLPKNWVDLTTSKKFNPKKDVLILNDPGNEEFQQKRNIEKFWHIVNGRSVAGKQATGGGRVGSNDIKYSVTATRIMEQIQKTTTGKESSKRPGESSSDATSQKRPKIFSQDVTGVQYTSGRASGSLTSTAMDVSHENGAREASQEEVLQAQFKVMRSLKHKGYVRMTTNLGEMVLELHCDIVPRTCTNFLGLCEAKKYDKTTFHRLIPKFMIQGGKSKIGEDASLWGPAFEDEFDDRLKHTGAGIVSMANAGPKTNKRQFFITFHSCPHLDRKHTVFGKVVEGLPVLEAMEKQETDSKDRPTKSITIESIEVLVNPAKEAEELETQRLNELAAARRQEAIDKQRMSKGQAKAVKAPSAVGAGSQSTSASGSSGFVIGKYLPKGTRNNNVLEENTSAAAPAPAAPRVVKPAKTKFGDFSAW
eukprot:Nitzschia sp. Nitz4//scaffold92_size79448//69088//70770//NITZ4_005403-RA/size79448-processed-gene-0.63-mRNA-1//1//CDS//3329560222//7606//frame0